MFGITLSLVQTPHCSKRKKHNSTTVWKWLRLFCHPKKLARLVWLQFLLSSVWESRPLQNRSIVLKKRSKLIIWFRSSAFPYGINISYSTFFHCETWLLAISKYVPLGDRKRNPFETKLCSLGDSVLTLHNSLCMFPKLTLSSLHISVHCHQARDGSWMSRVLILKGTHNADFIIESKVIYYLEQCGLRV